MKVGYQVLRNGEPLIGVFLKRGVAVDEIRNALANSNSQNLVYSVREIYLKEKI